MNNDVESHQDITQDGVKGDGDGKGASGSGKVDHAYTVPSCGMTFNAIPSCDK